MSILIRVLVTLALFVSALVVRAQTVHPTIAGQVTDASGASIPEATLTLRHVETGLKRSTRSNRQGFYVFAALEVGQYRLEAAKDGFKKLTVSELALRVAEQARIDLELEVGDLNEEITVSGDGALGLEESATLGAVIPNNYIVNLPLDGRNFLDLALLLPGVTGPAQGSAGAERGRVAFQTNGAREDANAFIYDGVYAIDPVLNSFALTPPVDAIREFRLQTANSDAGLGRNSGGQVAVALKQGGNDFHGSLYEFFRNDAMDARNFFDDPTRPTPKLRRNQYGFAVGGPLRRNSTFLFGDYEGLYERRAITRTTNVPTLAERQGDFSNSLLPAPIDFLSQQPFPNGQLPFAHPIGAGVAGLYPLPNRSVAGQNFGAAPTAEDHHDKFDVRLDQNLGQRGSLSGRYSFADRERFEPFAAASYSQLPGFGNDVFERGQNVMVSETHTFGARWAMSSTIRRKAGWMHFRSPTRSARRGALISCNLALSSAGCGSRRFATCRAAGRSISRTRPTPRMRWRTCCWGCRLLRPARLGTIRRTCARARAMRSCTIAGGRGGI